MIETSLYIFCGILLGVFYLLDGHTMVKNNIQDRYQRFRKLNKLVATRYKNICMIFYVSLQLICKALWINFLQWINNSVKQIDPNNLYEISLKNTIFYS